VPNFGPGGYVVLDTETTGLTDPARVIELAMIFVSDRGQIQGSWTTLLHGEGSAGGRRLEQVHGIRDHQLIGAPNFGEIAQQVDQAMRGRLVFAHNAKFDRARLNYELSLTRRPQLPQLCCTMYLGSYLGYGIMKLDVALSKFRIARTTAHCAHDDALATAKLLQHYLASHPAQVRAYLSSRRPH